MKWARVEDQFDMQPVIAQKNRLGRAGVAAEAHKLLGADQRHVVDQKNAILDVVAPHIGMAGALDGEGVVKEDPRPRNDPCPAPAFVAAFRRQGAHCIGAVETVIEAAPTGIGRIQRVAGIGDRHDQLWTRHCRDLGVGVPGLDLEVRPLGQQIADLL